MMGPVFNYVGWRLHDIGVRFYIFLKRDTSSANAIFDTLFALNQIWQIIFPTPPAPLNKFLFGLDGFATRRLIRIVQKSGLIPQFRFDVSGGKAIDTLVGAGQSALVISVHHPGDAMINTVFESRQISYSLLASSDNSAKKARLFGVRKEIDIVKRSPNSLLAVRQKVKSGKWVIAVVDFATQSGEIAISPALFELATRLNLPVLFFSVQDLRDRTVKLKIELGREHNSAMSGNQLALHFLDWIRGQGDDRNWKIEAWRKSP